MLRGEKTAKFTGTEEEKRHQGGERQRGDLMMELKTEVFFPNVKSFFFLIPLDDGKSYIPHYIACSVYKSTECFLCSSRIFF